MAGQHTPLMQQYLDIKKQYPDTLLLFQVGDFYELFFEDAQKAAAFLGITLTSRNKQDTQAIPLCGVPVHALDHYLIKLIKGGFHVAICDQLEEAISGKMVKRGVTRVLTPATLTDDRMLDPKTPSYLMAFQVYDTGTMVICLELLTGHIMYTYLSQDSKDFLDEVSQFLPDEIICFHQSSNQLFIRILAQRGYTVRTLENREPSLEFKDWIQEYLHEQIQSDLKNVLYTTLYSMYDYLLKNQPTALQAIRIISWYQPEQYAVLDDITLRNLEIMHNNSDHTMKNTLFSVLDGAMTSMGSRMIKKWLLRPLLNQEHIVVRQQVVQRFFSSVSLQQAMQAILPKIGDVERIVGRISLQKALVHDYVTLLRVLKQLPYLHEILHPHQDLPLIASLSTLFPEFNQLTSLLERAFHDNGSFEWIIKETFDENLAQVRSLIEHSNDTLLQFERKEQERTGINSLKVRFNQIQGYYIEITKTHAERIPDDYLRSQSLVGRERYTCLALKKLESEILSARAHAERIEKELFDSIKAQVYSYSGPLRMLAHQLAQIDALFGLSLVAYKKQYVCPTFDHNHLVIKQGRHPVVEETLQDPFIANDICLNEQDRMMIITGPNMGGKSTYLRQIALIAIMAQCGSFVPAESAVLPLFDRFFTRIGAGDNLAHGKSTFLVEMSETALICNKATQRSFIILDEVGRGTSTFDGMALAHAIASYIYEKIQSKTLFATHYHELTELAKDYTGIKNFYTASKKTVQGILLLHKIVPGTADGSFGIEIAQQAQLPMKIIHDARNMLQKMSKSSVHIQISDQFSSEMKRELDEWHHFKASIKDIDLDTISPRQAFDLLYKWRNEI